MDIFRNNTLVEEAKAKTGEGFQAIEITPDLHEKLAEIQAEVPDAVKVRSHKDDEGPEAAEGLLEDLHTVETSRFRGNNVSPAHAFELVYCDEDELINLQFVPGEESFAIDLDEHIRDQYPNALTARSEPELLDIEPGRYLCIADMGLNKYTLKLLRTDFRRDPYGSITTEMQSAAKRSSASVDVATQVMFRPEDESWTQGVGEGPSVTQVAHNLRQPTIRYERKTFTKERIEDPPSPEDKAMAGVLSDMTGEKGWNLNLRVITTAETPEAARVAARKVSDKFKNYYESTTQQRFEPIPLRGQKLRKELRRAIGREWVDKGIVKSEMETKWIVHCMDDQINTNAFNWALSNPGDGLPPGMPTYDFEAAGVAGESDAVKYLTMIESPEFGDDALWLGFDQATGKPAGLWTKFLNAHTQGTGRTRMGKSTLYRNVFSQNVRKGEGGFVITHGKPGEEDELSDDEELLAEIPDDVGPEDIVFIDTGDDFEKMVRFNLLEIPDNLEPGTAEHTSFMYNMCDYFCAAVAQAGGDDEGLYPLMKGLTRTTVRGMALSGHTATPMDLFAACSSPDNMGVLLDWMEEERIHYVRETVKRFKAKSDDDFEPVARRMDEILHNSTLRKLLSAREPTVSMQEIVDEGKWIFLRIDRALGNTETKFVTSPLVRIAAHAKKMSSNSDPFHVIWDEADKSASVHSDLAKLLSIMGGYKMYFHLIYQAPSNQLPPKLWDATSTQIDSTFSFRTASDDALQMAKLHSDNIKQSDLQHLPRYSFYASLDTESGEPASSILVRGAPPAREMREEHEGLDPLEKEDVVEFKQQCVDVHGEVPESDEERMALSEFYETPPSFDAKGNIIEEGEVEGDTTTSGVGSPGPADRARILQAVYEEAYYSAGGGHEPVPMKETTDRITRRLNGAYDPSTPAQWTTLLSTIPETRLDRDEIDGVLYLRCTPEGKARFTAPAIIAAEDESIDVQSNIGGEKHTSLMRDAVDSFLEHRLPMTITYQDGDELPDATAEPESEIYHRLQTDDSLDQVDIAELVAEFRETEGVAARWSGCREVYIEAESSTGDTKPAQTLSNLSGALNAGKMCLFLCREGTAQKVHEYLFEEPRCMYPYKRVEGAVRMYNRNQELRVGANDQRVYRPSGCGDSTWLYFEETDHYELRDSEGEVRGRFDSAEDIFTDVGAYPMSEDEFDDASKWSEVTCPFVPAVELPDGWEDRVSIVTVSSDGELEEFEVEDESDGSGGSGLSLADL